MITHSKWVNVGWWFFIHRLDVDAERLYLSRMGDHTLGIGGVVPKEMWPKTYFSKWCAEITTAHQIEQCQIRDGQELSMVMAHCRKVGQQKRDSHWY